MCWTRESGWRRWLIVFMYGFVLVGKRFVANGTAGAGAGLQRGRKRVRYDCCPGCGSQFTGREWKQLVATLSPTTDSSTRSADTSRSRPFVPFQSFRYYYDYYYLRLGGAVLCLWCVLQHCGIVLVGGGSFHGNVKWSGGQSLAGQSLAGRSWLVVVRHCG